MNSTELLLFIVCPTDSVEVIPEAPKMRFVRSQIFCLIRSDNSIRFPFIGVRENDKKPLTRILVKNIDDTYCFFYNFDDDREDSFAGFMRKHLVYLLEVINFEHNGRQGMLITFCARYLSLENFYVISWRTNAGD